MDDGRVPAATCPSCGKALDAVTLVDDSDKVVPTEGDVGICLYCCGIHEFMADGLRAISAEEFLDLPVDVRAQLKRAAKAIRDHRSRT